MKKWILVFAFVSLSVSVHAQQDPIKLGILLDTSEPLIVFFMEEEPKKRSLLIWGSLTAGIAAGIDGYRTGSRIVELSERLRISVGNTVDRREVYQRELTAAFAKYTSDLELLFLSSDLIVKGKPDFKRIDAEQTPYVVVIEEVAGLVTPSGSWGSLAPSTTATLRVYDVRKKKRTLKLVLQRWDTLNDDEDAAVDSADTFVSGYPQAVTAVSDIIFWSLSGRDVLHQLAKGTSFEDDFPSIKTLYEANAKRFDFVRPKIKGWKNLKTGNSHLYITAPKKDKQNLGIVSEIDPLLKELGQDFDSLESYIPYLLTRLADLGFGVESLTEVPLLQFTENWSSYMIPNASGGRTIFLHSKIENLVLTHQIFVLEENPLPILTKYQADIQYYVNNSVLHIK